MRSYLTADGKPRNLDVADMRRNLPEFEQAADRDLAAVQSWVGDYVKRHYAGKPMSFSVGSAWQTFKGVDPDPDKPSQEDWYYAVNGCHFAHTAQVRVSPGADGRAQVTIMPRLHVFDRYNWDKKFAHIKSKFYGIPIDLKFLDKHFAALHRSGLARDFDVVGAMAMQSSTVAIRSAWRANAVTSGF